jgi:hypothetical protein
MSAISENHKVSVICAFAYTFPENKVKYIISQTLTASSRSFSAVSSQKFFIFGIEEFAPNRWSFMLKLRIQEFSVPKTVNINRIQMDKLADLLLESTGTAAVRSARRRPKTGQQGACIVRVCSCT